MYPRATRLHIPGGRGTFPYSTHRYHKFAGALEGSVFFYFTVQVNSLKTTMVAESAFGFWFSLK